ncbi:MAG: N-6 DNA methylase [Desulfuromonadales bacterium]|nr:N-6 DNA methylase [Desulfuromonadales bacterium]
MNTLDILCRELDFQGGCLLPATDSPCACKPDDWLEKGEWLAAAKRAGAEKLFFVDNNPVAVFAECGAEIVNKIRAFNKVWCLARPRLFFLASEGEITVYDLAQRPVNENDADDWKNLKNLETLKNIREAATKLGPFHRDNIESGRLFGEIHFGDLKNRADQALIRDLKTVRRELINAGLSGEHVRFAHALIGRSIFIRYLEDRGVLTEKYFRNIAAQKTGWTELLRFTDSGTGIDFATHRSFYPRILANKEFTYALYKRLARDFNGDMFPEDASEEGIVSQDHLSLIQNLLYGDTDKNRKLFFYSYKFDIIPLDLISSIYEEFYHSSAPTVDKKSMARQDGAFYTPPVLAEFVLSRVLTSKILAKKPRVLDPACGSGIFLVEAFRRIVRHHWREAREVPTFDVLKTILRDQIAGIEVNKEAARVAAFSLYLSMLHYLDPPAIDQQIRLGNKLPNLVASDSRSSNHFHCILPQNTFDTGLIEANPLWKERFGPGCADVVVGNPPWGDPGKKADEATKARQAVMLDWCKANNKPIGDNEPSQAFLWRANELVKDNGNVGLLISAGALFKINRTSKEFRDKCFKELNIKEVYNFAHVREYFFKGAISPFVLMLSEKTAEASGPISYWSARESNSLEATQAILFSKYDHAYLRDLCVTDHKVWKALWWGNEKDIDLLSSVSERKHLVDFVDRSSCGRGFETHGNKDASDISMFQSLPHDQFTKYDSFDFDKFEDPPSTIYRLGNLKLYTGKRILIQRGIRERYVDKGQIISRFEDEDFCFSELLYGLVLKDNCDQQYKLILGVLWSSLARYYFFMTSGTWMPWHPKIHLDDILGLPISYCKTDNNVDRVIAVVNKLRDYHPPKWDLLHPTGIPEEEIEAQRRQWEAELDEAIFELYRLNDEERDLIRDCCEVTLPFFYKPFSSVGVTPAVKGSDLSWIETYARIFGRRWNAYLAEGQEMRADVHVGAHGNMLAVEFYPADKNDPWELKPKDDSWSRILEQIGDKLPQPMGTSRILLDGLVHVISNDGIIIIKRNEKRFWSRTLAREDADATLCKRMIDTMPDKRGLC